MLVEDSPEVWSVSELIARTAHAREDLERRIEVLQEEVRRLDRERTALRDEEVALRSSVARWSPHEEPAQPEHPTLSETLNEEALASWRHLPRTAAVLNAVQALTDSQGDASPSDVEATLQNHLRTDSRDEIGSALAYLKRKDRVRSVGRARWVWALTHAATVEPSAAD